MPRVRCRPPVFTGGKANKELSNMNLSIIRNLQDGVKVRARFARRDIESGEGPDYGQPRVVTLYIRKSEKELKQRGRVLRPAGAIVELAVKDFNWATYTEDHYCEEYNEFLAEEYRMQILQVVPENLQRS